MAAVPALYAGGMKNFEYNSFLKNKTHEKIKKISKVISPAAIQGSGPRPSWKKNKAKQILTIDIYSASVFRDASES